MKELLIENLEYCHEKARPACVLACPFALDITGFITKLERGNSAAAHRIYRSAVGFPLLVSECCNKLCEGRCLLKDYGDAPVRLNRLEQFIVSRGRIAKPCHSAAAAAPTRPGLPLRRMRAGKPCVWIIGGGAMGVACALRLLEKGYSVIIAEREKALGGRIRTLPNADRYIQEIESELGRFQYRAICDISVGFSSGYPDEDLPGLPAGNPDTNLLSLPESNPDADLLSSPGLPEINSNADLLDWTDLPDINPDEVQAGAIFFACDADMPSGTSRTLWRTAGRAFSEGLGQDFLRIPDRGKIFFWNEYLNAQTPFDVIQSLAGGFRAAADIDWYLASGVRKAPSVTVCDSSQTTNWDLASGVRKVPPVAVDEPLFMDPWLKAGRHYALRKSAAGDKVLTPIRANDSSRLCTLPPSSSWPFSHALPPSSSSIPEDVLSESVRCLKCSCSACLETCNLMAWFRKRPRRIAEEVSLTVDQKNIDGSNVNIATKMIASCFQCGACKKACGEGISPEGIFLEARAAMRQNGRMPPAYHEYWLQDMRHANGKTAQIFLPPPSPGKEAVLLFPGCQAGASNPDYVSASFDFIKRSERSAGLLVSCCGAPAVWSGDTALHGKAVASLRKFWAESGKPEILLLCPQCAKMFKRYLPEIKTSFLYPRLMRTLDAVDDIHRPLFFSDEDAAGLTGKPFMPEPCFSADPLATFSSNEILGIFDPCASRDFPELQQNIRDLLDYMGIQTKPLAHEMEFAQCCGFGGASLIANPEFVEAAIAGRIRETVPFVTYCTNCRDIFVARGKRAYHVLDLIFGIERQSDDAPLLSDRRKNREILRAHLMTIAPQDESGLIASPDKYCASVKFPEKVRKKLSDAWMLERDIIHVLLCCEQSKSWFQDRETGLRFGSGVVGHLTYWVEYRVSPTEPNTYIVENAYSHRIQLAWHPNG